MILSLTRMTLVFIGGGLGYFGTMSLEAVEALKKCEIVYVDVYTSVWSEDFFTELKKIVPNLVYADRKLLEDNVHKIIGEAGEKRVGILVPGDPFIATTHNAIRTLAHRKRVDVEIIHGVSVISASISRSGLHAYKFGKISTIPKNADLDQLGYVLDVLEQNLSNGLHSLVLLDTAEGGLTIGEAVQNLLKASERKRLSWLNEDMVAIGLARIGFPDFKIKVSTLKFLAESMFPPPPHSIIVPAKLHFTEQESLSTYGEAAVVGKLVENNPAKTRVRGYVEKCRRIIHQVSGTTGLDEYIKYVSNYVDDVEAFMERDDLQNALLAIGYAEGLLDALRFLKRVDFTW